MRLEIEPKKKKCKGESQSTFSGAADMNGLTAASKGAVQELRVSVDLLIKGYDVFRAHSPSCPFDIIAYHKEKMIQYKIEVRTGLMTIGGRMHWSRTQHEKHFDIYAIVFNSDIVYYDIDWSVVIL